MKLLVVTVFISMSGFVFSQLETTLLPKDFEMHLKNNSGIKVIALSKSEDFAKGHIESASLISRG